MRVIMLHENDNVQMVLSSILSRCGLRAVSCVSTVDQAWTAFTTLGADLLVIDVETDSTRGLDFIRRVRRDPASPERQTPIIALASAKSDEYGGWRNRARDMGADEFARVPIASKEFTRVVDAVLKDRRPFVESGDFSGPDRRRHFVGGPNERRKRPAQNANKSDSN